MPGYIDIHSHLLPGIDDGCKTLEESIKCVRTLKRHGFTGTICTPHIWPEMYPANAPKRIKQWTAQLQQQLSDQVLDFALWPGGELRLFDNAIAWMNTHGVPTLADSNCVLVDTWDDRWPGHIYETIDWLFDRGYQVIFAHPERSGFGEDYDKAMAWLGQRGVWFQGNCNPLSGKDVPGSQQIGWQLLDADRYTLLGLDMHGPNSLAPRLAGMRRVSQVHAKHYLHELMDARPRRLILGQSNTAISQ